MKNLKNTPIYVKPQLSSGGGSVSLTVMVGIRTDVGKPVDSIVVQLPLPPSVASSHLTANHGTVSHNHNTKVLPLPINLEVTGHCHAVLDVLPSCDFPFKKVLVSKEAIDTYWTASCSCMSLCLWVLSAVALETSKLMGNCGNLSLPCKMRSMADIS